jgi:hypothetical protein
VCDADMGMMKLVSVMRSKRCMLMRGFGRLSVEAEGNGSFARKADCHQDCGNN